MSFHPIFYFIPLLICSSLMAEEQWWAKGFREDDRAYYYTGVAQVGKDLQKARERAYHNAVQEAMKHNFGFLTKTTQNFRLERKNFQFLEEGQILYHNVLFKGVSPTREKLISFDHETLLYRELRYPKDEAELEKRRLRTRSIGDEQNSLAHEVGESGEQRGEVTIKTRPAGAHLFLTRDDEAYQVQGSSPSTFYLPLGTYKLDLFLDGHTTPQREIVVSGMKRTHEIELYAKKTRVDYHVIPVDSVLWVDGQRQETKTFYRSQGGKHRIRITHPDYFPIEEVIHIRPVDQQSVEHFMAGRPSTISILGKPKGAEVFLDGQRLGRLPLIARSVSPGRKLLRVTHPGHEQHVERINIEPNRKLRPMTLKLEKKKTQSVENRAIKNSDHTSFIARGMEREGARSSFYFMPVSVGSEATLWIMPLGFEVALNSWFYLDLNGAFTVENETIKVERQGVYSMTFTDRYELDTSLFYAAAGLYFAPYSTDHLQVAIGAQIYQKSAETEVNGYSLAETIPEEVQDKIREESEGGVSFGLQSKLYFSKGSDYAMRFEYQYNPQSEDRRQRIAIGISVDF